MIHIAWPWMLLALPLPWLLARCLPPVKPQGSALFMPFAAGIDAPPELRARKYKLLFVLIWLLLIAAAIRPQWLGDPLPAPTTGRRLQLAVDVSGSMATQDMNGDDTRLMVVQKVAGEFIRHRQGDQLSLILFGTRPYLQAPLTDDLATVGQFLREAMIGVAGQRTAIGDAIGLSIKRLRSDRAGPGGKMVLILLTDGENNAGLMDPLAAAKMAAAAGLRIYTIGVGAAVEQSLFGSRGNTDLDEVTLKSIARLTGGEYFRATDADTLKKVYARINTLEPAAGRDQWLRPHSEWFIWPLALALLLSVPTLLMRKKT